LLLFFRKEDSSFLKGNCRVPLPLLGRVRVGEASAQRNDAGMAFAHLEKANSPRLGVQKESD
jgi:hypothetical protein